MSNVGSAQERAGSIRGVVYDKDFDVPLALVQVVVLETDLKVISSEQGTYSFPELKPGQYTLVFSKEGYARSVRPDVLVTPGKLTDVNVSLAGEFTDMDEFVVEDLLPGNAGSEIALLNLRFKSPALLDSISSDLMSRAGASDAASALRLVPGATVTDGKFAVIRGLPDRYVSSQLNGFRLPSADEDTRAAELDQYPSSILDSIRISKTFTPDQQGDASGGAVDVRLKRVPERTIFQFSSQTSFNTQVAGRSNFLSYRGGGVNGSGRDNHRRRIQFENIGDDWTGAVGTSREEAPIDYKLNGAAGGSYEFDTGIRFGGFASAFYERDSSFFDDGEDNSLWVTNPGEGLVPETVQGVPQPGETPPGNAGDFKTALFDVTQGKQSVQWGVLGTLGVETENHQIGFTYLYTRNAEDKATLAEDTRGKEYFFPGYDRDDPTHIGNEEGNRSAAPHIRTETLEYTERVTETFQLNGNHRLPTEEFELTDTLTVLPPEIDWGFASSSASQDQPDKRQFGTLWQAASFVPGRPPFSEDKIEPAEHFPFKPAAVFSLGNLQRIFKRIEEESDQYFINFKVPFRQWTDSEGYFKLGFFDDRVDREFRQETFTNSGDFSTFQGDFDDYYSGVFPGEDGHDILASDFDVDYDGKLDVSAWYSMLDLPITSYLNVVGGFRVESTEIEVVNIPEEFATWFPPNALGPVELEPGDADVVISEDDLLPSFGLVVKPVEQVTLRASYSETIARPTFKELTPVLQQEFLGGPIFIGNPEVQLSKVKNYDIRLDYKPYEGGFLSASWFTKDIDGAIENVQRFVNFNFTTPRNFPEATLKGWEFEARQNLGNFFDGFEPFSVGANATLIDSEVRLPADERAQFDLPNIQAPQSKRDATNAPEHLYNIYLNFDYPSTGTRAGLFYTVRGDTLVAGAGTSDGNFVPSVYESEFDTLNFTVSQTLWDNFMLSFKAKNLTNPKIKTVYRSAYVPGGDVTRTSFSKGVEFSLSLSARFEF